MTYPAPTTSDLPEPNVADATGSILTTPLARVVLDVDGELVEHRVRIVNADMLAFDRERSRLDWPGADVAPMLWVTYCAWRAMVRLGLTKLTYPSFETNALQVEAINNAKSEVDPTRTAVAAE